MCLVYLVKWFLFVLVWLFFFANSVHATGHLMFSTDFSRADNWQEVANYQHLEPNLPCRGPDSAAYHWQVNHGQANLSINFSVPCSVISVPSGVSAQEIIHRQIEFDWSTDVKQADRNWLLVWQNPDNYLGFHIFDNQIYFEKKVNGTNYVRADYRQYYEFSSNTTYHVRLDYFPQNHQIEVHLNHELVWQFNESLEEPQLRQGTTGLMGSVGAAVPRSVTTITNWKWWEYDYTGTNLDVIAWQQTAEPWASKEYNHADEWAQNESPQIKRWGCALTAAAMVANYHGLTALPDGSNLDPGSLNTWLNKQPDGYWSEGLINWRAISRLSAVLADKHPGLPKLEFSYHYPVEPLNWLQQQLSQGRPAILAQPHHFVVATGYEEVAGNTNLENFTWLINDPFYSYTTLEPYHKKYESARLYTPSHTDLSAITMVVPSSWELSGQGEKFPYIWETSSLGNRWKVYDLAKPKKQHYQWELITSGQVLEPLVITTYTPDGEVKVRSELIQPTSESSKIEVELADQPAIFVSPNKILITPQQWSYWLESGLLRSPFVKDEFEQAVSNVQRSADYPEASRVDKEFKQKLKMLTLRHWISGSVCTILEQILQQQLLYKYP